MASNKEVLNAIQLMGKDVKIIRKDLDYHIARTDILESRLQKMWFMLAFLTGAGIIQYKDLLINMLGL